MKNIQAFGSNYLVLTWSSHFLSILTYIENMKLTKIVVGEIIVLIASVLIFRSLWTLMDKYFGFSYLIELLIIGLVLTIIGLIILNHEIKSEMEKTAKPKNASS